MSKTIQRRRNINFNVKAIKCYTEMMIMMMRMMRMTVVVIVVAVETVVAEGTVPIVVVYLR